MTQTLKRPELDQYTAEILERYKELTGKRSLGEANRALIRAAQDAGLTVVKTGPAWNEHKVFRNTLESEGFAAHASAQDDVYEVIALSVTLGVPEGVAELKAACRDIKAKMAEVAS